MAVDKVRGIRRQEHSRPHEILRRAPAMRRRLGQDEIIERMARRAQRCSLRRRDVARADAVALDVPVAVLRSDVLRQHLEAAFRRRIRRHRLAPHFTEHRADVDDLAMSLAQHAGQHSLRDDERSRQVDIDNLAEILRRHLEHRDALDDARIVHEDVDGPKLLLDIRDHRTDRLFIRDIADIAMRLNAIFLVVRQRLVHMRLTAAVERDFRARISISLRNRIANAIGRARHQCHLARQRELFRDIKHIATPFHAAQPSFRRISGRRPGTSSSPSAHSHGSPASHPHSTKHRRISAPPGTPP